MDNAPSWMRYPKKMGRGKAWFKFILLEKICSENLSKKVQFSLESLSDKNQCFLKFLLQLDRQNFKFPKMPKKNFQKVQTF